MRSYGSVQLPAQGPQPIPGGKSGVSVDQQGQQQRRQAWRWCRGEEKQGALICHITEQWLSEETSHCLLHLELNRDENLGKGAPQS